MPTRRELVVIQLEDGPVTAMDLAAILGQKVQLIEADLVHVQKSNRGRFHMDPAVCSDCDFVFTKRDRLDAPSKCPQCRNQRIDGPWFHMDEE